MTDPLLKPCPFCGTAARFDWEEKFDKYYYYVVCPVNECVARMGTDYCETKEGAATIWNRRPDNQPEQDAARYQWIKKYVTKHWTGTIGQPSVWRMSGWPFNLIRGEDFDSATDLAIKESEK